jgi:hypothetical protein
LNNNYNIVIKTNGYKAKIYCNIYSTGIDVNQNYMVYSNNLFCSLYKNRSLSISDQWTPSLKKVPLHPKLTRVTLHKHLPVEYKARQQNYWAFWQQNAIWRKVSDTTSSIMHNFCIGQFPVFYSASVPRASIRRAILFLNCNA